MTDSRALSDVDPTVIRTGTGYCSCAYWRLTSRHCQLKYQHSNPGYSFLHEEVVMCHKKGAR